MTNGATWQPLVRANLLFIVHDEKILLIRKKRGFEAGKINEPGEKSIRVRRRSPQRCDTRKKIGITQGARVTRLKVIIER